MHATPSRQGVETWPLLPDAARPCAICVEGGSVSSSVDLIRQRLVPSMATRMPHPEQSTALQRRTQNRLSVSRSRRPIRFTTPGAFRGDP